MIYNEAYEQSPDAIETLLQETEELLNSNENLKNKLRKTVALVKAQSAVVKSRQRVTAEAIEDTFNSIYEANAEEFELLSFSGTLPLSEIVQMIFGKRGYQELENSIHRISSSIEEACVLAKARVEKSKGVFEYSEACLPILLHFLWRKHQDKRCVKNLLNTFDFS